MPHNNIDNVTIETYGGGYGVFAWSGTKLVKSFFTRKVEFVPRKRKSVLQGIVADWKPFFTRGRKMRIIGRIRDLK